MADLAGLLLAQLDGHIARLTINRPEKRNAMTLSMWRALGNHLEDWAANAEVRILILTGGADKSFCADA